MKYRRVKNGDDWMYIFIGAESAYSMNVVHRDDMLFFVYNISDLINYRTIHVGEYFKTIKSAKQHFIGMVEREELK